MIDNYAVPWLIAFGMGLAFALLARGAGRNWVLWALTGFYVGLSSTTIVLGLSQGAFIPMSYEQAARFSLESVAGALFLNLLLGWIFTAGLHGQHLILCRWIIRLFTKPTPSSLK